MTLGIRTHIFTLEILGGSLPVVYAMVIEALHKAVRHQSQADDGEDDGKTEDESPHPKALANAATAPLPKVNKGDALRRTLMLCWFL